LGDVLGVFVVDTDLLVHIRQVSSGELRGDAVEQRFHVGAGGQHLVANDGRDVVGQLQVLVVFEQGVGLQGDIRVSREQQADVDVATVQRGYRQWAARVE